ncbi:MAG: hypothetical protein ABSH20_31000, partial [Tepidisphaeraceae bacterium]
CTFWLADCLVPMGHQAEAQRVFERLLELRNDESAPVIGAALYDRFSSRGEADFADKVLSAMRRAFGGHVEKAASPKGGDA